LRIYENLDRLYRHCESGKRTTPTWVVVLDDGEASPPLDDYFRTRACAPQSRHHLLSSSKKDLFFPDLDDDIGHSFFPLTLVILTANKLALSNLPSSFECIYCIYYFHTSLAPLDDSFPIHRPVLYLIGAVRTLLTTIADQPPDYELPTAILLLLLLLMGILLVGCYLCN
jgi:hypothetical protein